MPPLGKTFPRKNEALLKTARERWMHCDEAEAAQRKRILAAKQFRAGNQWPEEIKIQRAGGQAISGQPATPPRPCLTIDRLSQPVRQVSNLIKGANFAIDVLPDGNGSDVDTAEMWKGYFRNVQNQARGESPVEWAADQAIEGGIGWFRILTDYVYDSGEDVPPEALFDQELKLARITNNLTVYDDPWAMLPTRSDSLYKFVTEDLSKSEFEERWPDADLASLEDFSTTGDAGMKDWVTKDTIRIAEYWRVEHENQTWIETVDGQVIQKTKDIDIPDDQIKRTRVIRVPKVRGSKITATQELEAWDWVGSKIPIIPVIGEELNIDGKVWVRGIIEEGMDAQRMVNYTYSGAVETFALAPKAPFIAAADQVTNYRNLWMTANTVNHSVLLYDPITIQGSLAPMPQRNTAEPALQGAAMLLSISEDAIKATTGFYDPSLGKQTGQVKSGRQQEGLQAQAEQGSSNYPDNVRRALIYAGTLMMEIAPKITREGQLLQIIGQDDQPQQVILGQPHLQQYGQAKPVDPNAIDQHQQAMVKFYDRTKGRYAVTVAVGKSYSTKKEEGAAAIGQLIPGLPPMMGAVLAPEYVENLNFPGAHAMAEKMRKTLPPQLQDQQDGQINPQQVQQQLAQQAQMIQMLSKELDAKNQLIQTDQIKAQQEMAVKQAGEQAESQRTLAKLSSDERARALDNLVKLAIAEISAKAAQSKADADYTRAQLGFGHDAVQNALDRQVQTQQADTDRAFEQQENTQDRQMQAQQQPEAGA